jgi:hypothetical protein
MHLLKAPRLRLLLAACAVTLGLAGGTVALAQPALADQIGQAPTAANITGNGSFATTSTRITGASGFGGGMVYYPTTAGTYPVIAVSPGFTATWSSLSWLGPRVSSWGFVVVGIETNTLFDRLLNTRLERRCKRRRSNPFHAVPQWRVTARIVSPADYARRP